MAEGIKEHLLGKVSSLVEKNKALLDAAEEGHRDLTDTETAEFTANMKQIEEHKIEVKGIEQRESMMAQLDALGAVTEMAEAKPAEQVRAKTPGDAVIQSAEYKALIAQYRSSGMPRFDGLAVEHKAAGDPILLSDATNQSAVREGWDPRLYLPSMTQEPLSVASLLGQVEADGNITRAAKVITRTAPTGNPTAEGAAKKGTEFEFDDVSVTLEKNTAFGTMSDEFIADAPALAGYVNNQIGFMVEQVEEADIVAVLYSGASTVTGSTIAASPNGFDAIRDAMRSIRVNHGVPDAIVLHPNDAAFLDVIRDTGTGYYSGGPFGPPRSSVWSRLNYVETTAADPGRPLVGAFRAGATLYSRGGLRVEFSNSHSDYFEKDKVAIRAYKRSKAAKHYPEWFVQCDIGAS